MNHLSAYRRPAEESIDLYPGLVVWDARQSGSITIGRSRLPVWAVIADLVHGGWPAVLKGWDYIEDDYDFDTDDMTAFLAYLLEARGEFGRLLLTLANAERVEGEAEQAMTLPAAWWKDPDLSKPVADQLKRCLAVLEERETP